MSFPRYPSYKDSGVEWLGDVPEGWRVIRMGMLEKSGDDFVSGPFGSSLGSSRYVENGIPVIRGLNTTLNAEARFVPEDFVFVGEETFVELKRCDARPGDVVFTARGTVGKVGVVPDSIPKALISPNQLRYRPDLEALSVDYLFYLFSSSGLLSEIGLVADSVAQPNLNLGNLKALRVSLPPKSEQTQIAAFLDSETAKIDELVAEQRRLMELLKEKRQAVISHAVTKGLNPDAPMKPSGIEWLGNVSAHWAVVPLKHLCVLLKDGTHLPPERVDDGIPLLSVRNLVDGEFVLREDDSLISEESYQDLSRAFVPKAEDVLLAIVGATLGKTAVIPSGLGPFHIQRSVAIFRTKPDVLRSGFLNLVFQSSSFQALLWELVGYSAQPGIYLGTLQNIRIPVPPLNEQTRILESISSVANELTGLTAEAQRAIDLLQERRTALISAAVTGQIDVRPH